MYTILNNKLIFTIVSASDNLIHEWDKQEGHSNAVCSICPNDLLVLPAESMWRYIGGLDPTKHVSERMVFIRDLLCWNDPLHIITYHTIVQNSYLQFLIYKVDILYRKIKKFGFVIAWISFTVLIVKWYQHYW